MGTLVGVTGIYHGITDRVRHRLNRILHHPRWSSHYVEENARRLLFRNRQLYCH
ncbi:hypothetical protein CPB85DRAFT_1300521 [Mucidula mucida]|nr:hypothetical protein CPB85DRAFT_1325122 [Mucidula mucida]KAF8912593.1 hypothetical protein CPB85DRAFT_1300521 [Mucidula mucida]